MDLDELVKAVAFSQIERETFPYIDEYSRLMERWFISNVPDENIIKRYILASFWLDYRASTHAGEEFQIERISEKEYQQKKEQEMDYLLELRRQVQLERFSPQEKVELDERFDKEKHRRDAYFDHFDMPIQSTQEYVEKVGFPSGEDPGEYLFKYVTQGRISVPPTQ